MHRSYPLQHDGVFMVMQWYAHLIARCAALKNAWCAVQMLMWVLKICGQILMHSISSACLCSAQLNHSDVFAVLVSLLRTGAEEQLSGGSALHQQSTCVLATPLIQPWHLINSAMQMGARILFPTGAIVLRLVDHSVGATAAAQLMAASAPAGQAPREAQAARTLRRAGH